MPSKFDLVYEQLITELITPSAKRRSRYWDIEKPNISGVVRGVRNNRHKTASQNTKLGQQQYVGNGVSKIRTRNVSKKGGNEAGIANGIGGYATIDGTNPKEPGASVNSKQGDMEIKYRLGKNLYRVGPRIKTDYGLSEPEE